MAHMRRDHYRRMNEEMDDARNGTNSSSKSKRVSDMELAAFMGINVGKS